MTDGWAYNRTMLHRMGMLIALLAFTLFTVASAGHALAMGRHQAMDHHAEHVAHALPDEANACCADRHSGAMQDGLCFQACVGLTGVLVTGTAIPSLPRQLPAFVTLIEVLPPGCSPDLTERPPKLLLL